MHIASENIEHMQLVELDDLRHQLRLTKRELCLAADIDPSTYTRWMRYVRGLPGGCSPQPRSLKAIRAALQSRSVPLPLAS